MNKGIDALPKAQLQTLQYLLDLVEHLYQETEGFAEEFDEGQPWYNRGYANGMVAALTSLGYRPFVDARLRTDDPEVLAGHEMMAWGKAYRHGFEVGAKDVGDVIGPIASHPSAPPAPGDSS